MDYASGRMWMTETVKEPSQSFLRDLALAVAVRQCGRLLDRLVVGDDVVAIAKSSHESFDEASSSMADTM